MRYEDVFREGNVAYIYRIDSSCPECGRTLRVRHRKKDGEPFAACTGFPDCRFAADAVPEPRKRRERVVYRDTNVQWLERELLEAIATFHPDRNPDGADANEITARLNRIRTRLRSGK